MAPSLIVLLLALLLGIQPVTTDLYLPALPALTAELNATVHQGQLTLTALLLCFGLSQLVFGPLSDRFGRRPVLLFGMVLYTLAGIGNMLASSIEWLIFTRAVQGAAMGAGVMCARAILRGASAKLREAAFSEDVLKARHNSEPVEVAPGTVVVARAVVAGAAAIAARAPAVGLELAHVVDEGDRKSVV